MIYRRGKKQRGITLAELFISLSILSFLVMGLFMTLGQVIKSTQKNTNLSSGYMAANSVLKEYILDYQGNMVPGTIKSIKEIGDIKYNYKIVVQKPDPAKNALQISVSVNWRGEVDDSGRKPLLESKVSTIIYDSFVSPKHGESLDS